MNNQHLVVISILLLLLIAQNVFAVEETGTGASENTLQNRVQQLEQNNFGVSSSNVDVNSVDPNGITYTPGSDTATIKLNDGTILTLKQGQTKNVKISGNSFSGEGIQVEVPQGKTMDYVYPDGHKEQVTGKVVIDSTGKIQSATGVQQTGIPASPNPTPTQSPSGQTTPPINPAITTGPAIASNVEGWNSDNNGNFEVERVESLQRGDAMLTNGENIVATADTICGKNAGSIQVGAQFDGNVNDFCIKGNRVDVKHADEVRVKCGATGATWQAKDIRDATISIGMYVQFNTSTEQSVDVRDCNNNAMLVTFKGNDSKAEFEKDGQEVHLQHADVLLNVSDGLISQEVAQANGSASLVFDKATGLVQFVDMNPTFSYEFRTGDIRKDFAFKAEGRSHLLWIHRKATEPIPADAQNCIFCSVVNMPDHVITVKSDVEYQRKWWRMDGNTPVLVSDAARDNGYVTVLRGKENKSIAILKLDNDFIFIDDMYIKTNAPPLFAAFSNFLNVTEMAVDDVDVAGAPIMATHRLVGIDDKITDPKNLAQSIVKNYRTAYSQATMQIEDNHVTYKRNTLTVNVLSPFETLLSTLMNQLMALNKALGWG